MFTWKAEVSKVERFLQERLSAGDDIYAAARTCWIEIDPGLMILKDAIKAVLNVDSRTAAQMAVKATFEIPRPNAESQSLKLK